VKNIAVAASLGQMFRGVKLCEGFSAKDLWTHCIAVAVASREIARQMKLPVVDETFLAGMIHDIGILVSLQVFPERLREACTQTKLTGGDFCEIERQIVGVDHQQLGMGLAEQWKFPRSCQMVAGFHHQPATLADDHRVLVTLVFVADTICCQANQGFTLTALHQKLEDAQLDRMSIDMAVVERVRGQLPELMSAASSLMG